MLKAGGTVVNFNPLYSLEEIEFQIRDSETKIMVTLDLKILFDKVEAMLTRGALEGAVVESFASLLPTLKSVGLKLTKRAQLAKLGASPMKRSIVRAADLLANDGRYQPPVITPDAIAVLQYTGGTTGTPKGAMLTHANIAINVAQVKAWRNQPPEQPDRILGVLPLFHVFAMTTVMNFGLSSGMEMILLPKFELIQTLKLIAKLRPTMMPGVPTLFGAMLRHPTHQDLRPHLARLLHLGRRGLAHRGEARLRGAGRLQRGGRLRAQRDLAGGHLQSDEFAARGLDRAAAAGHGDQHPLARGSRRRDGQRRGR